MAAAIKALNARIRANPVLDYFCSTRKPQRSSSQRLLAIGDLLDVKRLNNAMANVYYHM